MKLACNYAIVRFLPYLETGEFVNVGVVLICAQTGYFDFLLARRRRRVADFFQELDITVYKAGLSYFTAELSNFQGKFSGKGNEQFAFPVMQQQALDAFRGLVRPRESLFRFSAIQTTLADDPEAKLNEIFEHHVNRQFAQEKEYQEKLMTNHLREVFQGMSAAKQFKPENVGNDRYAVLIPFVYLKDERPFKAIKPLDLDKPTSTKIYEHGDQWITRISRLTDIGELPEQMLFAVRTPEMGGSRGEAATDILDRLKRLRAQIVPFGDEPAVIEFTRVE